MKKHLGTAIIAASVLAVTILAAVMPAQASDVLYLNCKTDNPPADPQHTDRLFGRDFPAVVDFDNKTVVDNYPGWWQGAVFKFKITNISGSRISAHLMNTDEQRANGSEMYQQFDTATGRYSLTAYGYYLGKKTTELESGICTKTSAPKS